MIITNILEKPYTLDDISFVQVRSQSQTKVFLPFTTSPISSPLKDPQILDYLLVQFNNIGLQPRFPGFRYLVDAIITHFNHPEIDYLEELSKSHNETKQTITFYMERAIYYCFNYTHTDNYLDYYTAPINSNDGVPTISEFINFYTEKIKSL